MKTMTWAEIKAEWANQNDDPERSGAPSPVTVTVNGSRS